MLPQAFEGRALLRNDYWTMMVPNKLGLSVILAGLEKVGGK
jgi:hypothetical protein